MAAHEGHYFTIDAQFRDSNDVLMTINPARAFTDEATLMSLFYLDDVVPFTAKDSSGNQYHGFWGIVNNDPNGFNYKHHSTTRLVEVFIKEIGATLIFFNDAGLNTYGDVTIAHKSNSNTAVGVTVIFTLTLKSAYLLKTTAYGMAYSLDGVDYGEPTYPIEYAQNTTNLKDIALQQLQPGTTINIGGIIVNDEGAYPSPRINYTVPYLPWVVNGEAQYASDAQAAPLISLYPASYPIGVGTVLYPNATQGVPYVRIDNGYYADDEYWYQLSDNNGQDCTIVAKGILGAWPEGDPDYTPPPATWQTRQYVHYTSGTYGNGCAIMDNGNRTNMTLYRHVPSDKYYLTQSTVGTVAPDGIYYDGTKADWNDSYKFVFISGGFVVAEGNCTDGMTIT